MRRYQNLASRRLFGPANVDLHCFAPLQHRPFPSSTVIFGIYRISANAAAFTHGQVRLTLSADVSTSFQSLTLGLQLI